MVIIRFLAVLGLMLSLIGCGEETPPPPPDVMVRTMEITLDDLVSHMVYPGAVRGRYESRLGFQVSGRISRRLVDVGDAVKTGQALFEIDPKDIEESVRIAAAQVESAKSRMDLAQADFSRYERLWKDGAAAKSQYDQYKTAYDAAVETWRQATAQHQQSLNELDYTRLTAESDGVISELSAEVGQVVAAGQAVATLVRDGALEVEINVPENRVSDLRLNQPSLITFWALPGLELTGAVREISPMADGQTRTYRVRVGLKQPPPEVQLGMTASVRAVAGRSGERRIALVPLSAIYQTGEKPRVWLVRDNRVTLQDVATEDFDENQVIVTDGLSDGDLVVTAGVHKLHEGQAVRLMAGGEKAARP